MAAICWSWGSPTLVRTLLREGLVDELRLMIEPVILGGGKTIFPDDGELRTLELVSTVTSGTGVHVCTYRPVAEGQFRSRSAGAARGRVPRREPSPSPTPRDSFPTSLSFCRRCAGEACGSHVLSDAGGTRP